MRFIVRAHHESSACLKESTTANNVWTLSLRLPQRTSSPLLTRQGMDRTSSSTAGGSGIGCTVSCTQLGANRQIGGAPFDDSFRLTVSCIGSAMSLSFETRLYLDEATASPSISNTHLTRHIKLSLSLQRATDERRRRNESSLANAVCQQTSDYSLCHFSILFLPSNYWPHLTSSALLPTASLLGRHSFTLLVSYPREHLFRICFVIGTEISLLLPNCTHLDNAARRFSNKNLYNGLNWLLQVNVLFIYDCAVAQNK